MVVLVDRIVVWKRISGPWAPDLTGLLAREQTVPLIWCLVSENHYLTNFSVLLLKVATFSNFFTSLAKTIPSI